MNENTERLNNLINQMQSYIDYSENKQDPGIDWSKVEVDTKILVRDSEDQEWEKKHLAVFKNGFVHAYIGGMTSFSSPVTRILKRWKYAKLWTS